MSKVILKTETYTSIIIVFNLVMVTLLFATSELILLRITGYKLVSVGTQIFYEYPLNPSGTPIPTALPYPIPNYPLMIFIMMVIVNVFFYYRLKKKVTVLKLV
ncbi:MAG: hypothetical protein NWE96_09515 [Candidatus Bathyarchaeota archaeon]|nr:hypothetical protein [Candidatus Bathyarchaeota archaeon]